MKVSDKDGAPTASVSSARRAPRAVRRYALVERRAAELLGARRLSPIEEAARA